MGRAGKAGLNPSHLISDGVSYDQARLWVGKFVKLNGVALLAHVSNNLLCHPRRYGRVPVVSDHQKWAVGRLLAEPVPVKKFLNELILPIPLQHFARGKLGAITQAATAFVDLAIQGNRLLRQHVAYVEIRINGLIPYANNANIRRDCPFASGWYAAFKLATPEMAMLPR